MLSKVRETLSVLRFAQFDASAPGGRSKERYRRVAISSASSLAAKAVSAATTLISIPLALEYLGRERFGLWATLSTLIGFLALADLGVGNALVNAVAKSAGKDDRRMAQNAVSSAFFLLIVQALLMIFLYIALRDHVDWATVFNLHTETAKVEISKAIAMLVGIVALQLPLAMAQRVQEGYQEGYVNNICQAIASCLGLIALLVVIRSHLGLVWLVAAVAGAPVAIALINSLIQFAVIRRWLRPNLKHFDRTECGELIRSGFVFLLLTFLTFWGMYSDNLVISRMLGASAVTDYALVQRLSLVGNLFWAFIVPLWPAYGEALSRHEYVWIQKTFKRFLVASLAAGVIVGGGLAIFGHFIIRLWIGPEAHVEPGVLYGFACYILLTGIIGNISALMNTGPLLRRQMWSLAAAALASLWLKVELCRIYGASGVIWATIIAFASFYVLPGLWIIRESVYPKSGKRSANSA